MNFTQLRVHSHYSIQDGLMSVDDIIQKALDNKQKYVALTDLSNLYGAAEFFEKSIKKGLKPIIGVDAYIETDITNKNGYDSDVRLLLLAKDEKGYKNLIKLVSKSNLENNFANKSIIKQSWLEQYNQGLIALSGEIQTSELYLATKNDSYQIAMENAKKIVSFYKNIFNNEYYIEAQRYDFDEEEYLKRMFHISAHTNTPLVATNPVLFANREDYYAHEIRTCVNKNIYVDDYTRKTPYTREQYFLSPSEMMENFKDLPIALENTNKIAEKCNLKLDLDKNYKLPVYSEKDNDLLIEQQAKEGLIKRLTNIEDKKNYLDRLNTELSVIKKMGFSSYFLIVSDFIKWAKANDIAVGVGRGSGVGSLVAYSLEITGVDPLKHNLLFERFLNPERVSMPDFDVDFEPERRKEVFDYLKEKYGEDKVSQIITYNKLTAKAVVNDVSKILNEHIEVKRQILNAITRAEFKQKNKAENFKLIELLDDETFVQEYNNSHHLKRLFDLCVKLENTPKSLGKHPAGVIISKNPLVDEIPLTISYDGEEQSIVSQYDKNYIEDTGLVKFDLLALKNLSFMKRIVGQIKKQNPNFNLENIDINDQEVYKKIFNNANTMGVFQFESIGMKNTLRSIKANNFNDLVAANALYRPGAMGYASEYSKRKESGKVNYLDPRLEEILKETYGVMIYQEQVMQIAQKLAGYSLGQADLLRRAMGKKKPAEMALHFDKFVKGAVENGVKEDIAKEIFKQMEQFAEYGFNKSHSVAYATISYQNAYLKAKYPAIFFCTLMDFADKTLAQVYKEIKNSGLTLRVPDVNLSQFDSSLLNDKEIILGLNKISEISSVVLRKILSERNLNGNYKNIQDFCQRLGRDVVTNKNMECLINAGFFDSLNNDRGLLLNNINTYVSFVAKNSKKNKKEGFVLGDLFGNKGIFQNAIHPLNSINKDNEEVELIENIIDIELSEDELINREKKAIGISITINKYEKYIEKLSLNDVLSDYEETQNVKNKKSLLIGGIINDIIINKNKNKKEYARVIISSDSDEISVSVFEDDNVQYLKQNFQVGDFMLTNATISKTDSEYTNINTNTIYSENDIKNIISKVNNYVESNEITNKDKILRLKRKQFGMNADPQKINKYLEDLEINDLNTIKYDNIYEIQNKQVGLLTGIITNIKLIKNTNNEFMILTLSDGYNQVDVSVYDNNINEIKNKIKRGSLLLINLDIYKNNKNYTTCVANKIFTVEDIKEKNKFFKENGITKDNSRYNSEKHKAYGIKLISNKYNDFLQSNKLSDLDFIDYQEIRKYNKNENFDSKYGLITGILNKVEEVKTNNNQFLKLSLSNGNGVLNISTYSEKVFDKLLKNKGKPILLNCFINKNKNDYAIPYINNVYDLKDINAVNEKIATLKDLNVISEYEIKECMFNVKNRLKSYDKFIKENNLNDLNLYEYGSYPDIHVGKTKDVYMCGIPTQIYTNDNKNYKITLTNGEYQLTHNIAIKDLKGINEFEPVLVQASLTKDNTGKFIIGQINKIFSYNDIITNEKIIKNSQVSDTKTYRKELYLYQNKKQINLIERLPIIKNNDVENLENGEKKLLKGTVSSYNEKNNSFKISTEDGEIYCYNNKKIDIKDGDQLIFNVTKMSKENWTYCMLNKVFTERNVKDNFYKNISLVLNRNELMELNNSIKNELSKERKPNFINLKIFLKSEDSNDYSISEVGYIPTNKYKILKNNYKERCKLIFNYEYFDIKKEKIVEKKAIKQNKI